MGLVSFVKDAGEKLFGGSVAQTVAQPSAADPNKVAAANAAAAAAIKDYIQKMNLDAQGLAVEFDAASGTATVSGAAADQSTREKIVLCCGNVAGVVAVQDKMTVTAAEPAAQYYTVTRGDTLSKIAKQYYGDANKYPTIFEANKPMLHHPDKIYPGQVLRIPPK